MLTGAPLIAAAAIFWPPFLCAVVFTLAANQRFRHKIVLDPAAGADENEWLGLTFRTSTTFVRQRDGRACFEDGTPLALADEGQRKEFYALRKRENAELDFVYPQLTYTISKSDLMPPS